MGHSNWNNFAILQIGIFGLFEGPQLNCLELRELVHAGENIGTSFKYGAFFHDLRTCRTRVPCSKMVLFPTCNLLNQPDPTTRSTHTKEWQSTWRATGTRIGIIKDNSHWNLNGYFIENDMSHVMYLWTYSNQNQGSIARGNIIVQKSVGIFILERGQSRPQERAAMSREI